jgi:hypothetical protein
MAIYNKGSRPYRGPYSPDYTGDPVGNYQSGTNDPNAYDPTNDVAALRAGRPTAPNYDGRGIDCSRTIDPQVKYGYGFDDNKNANWSADKSADGLGGFSGDLLPGGRGNNHPKKGKGV